MCPIAMSDHIKEEQRDMHSHRYIWAFLCVVWLIPDSFGQGPPRPLSDSSTGFQSRSWRSVAQLTSKTAPSSESSKKKTSPDSGFICHGGVVTLTPLATDRDLIQLDNMPAVKEIRGMVGPNSWGGPKITDAGLTHLKNLKQLEVLDLPCASLITDAGLVNLAGLTQLQTLSLDNDDKITDAGLAHLKALKKLKVLRLYGAALTDAGLEQIKDLVEIEDLQLGRAPVSDAGLVYLEGLHKLKTLDLQGTKITDAGLVHLRSLSKLEWLALNNTQVGNMGLNNLKGLKNLRNLYLGGTNVTKKGKENLQKSLSSLKMNPLKEY
jgi:Leucine-rich repeat (LRR) protein